MEYVAKFDPARDIQKHVPDMAVDLAAAIESGVVIDTGTIGEFNDIDSPANVWRRVADAFDAMDLKRTVLKHGEIKAPANTGGVSTEPPSGSSE